MASKQDPGSYTPGSLEWLAACVLEDRRQEARNKPGAAVPWYFMYPTHPAVRVLLEDYKRRLGLPASVAMSDMERTLFELQMLSEEAQYALMRYYGARKKYAGDLRRAINGDIDFCQLLAE